MRRILINVIGVTPAIAAAIGVAGAAPNLRDLVQAAAESRPLPVTGAPDSGALLAGLAGADPLPLRCATPITLALAAAPEATGAPGVLTSFLQARPGAEDRILLTRDGRFTLHYTQPGVGANGRDDDATAEAVARTAEALVASRAYLVGTLGWPDPAPGPERIPVFLGRIGHGLDGFVVPGRPGARGAGVWIDANLPSERLMPAVLHQTAHLSLLSYGRTAPWWHEATAGYLTLAGSGNPSSERPALTARLQASALALDSDELALLPGTLLWPLFLAERTGDPTVVRQIWQTQSEEAIDPLAAADVVLRARGLTLDAALREMTLWNLFTGTRDDGAHYRSGGEFPEAGLAAIGPDLPVAIEPPDAVEPAGSIAYRLPASRQRGALEVAVEARGGAPAADVLVFFHSGDRRPVLLPLDLTPGRAQLSIPWSEAREAWIVLRNGAGEPEAGAAQFDLRFALDPRAPFDLATFAAAPVGSAIVLEWTTASERGLVGWNVYRSDAPAGPFTRQNAVALPAYGDGGSDTGYLFVDETARPGRRLYYQVEGITAAGLTDRSHTASARLDRGR